MLLWYNGDKHDSRDIVVDDDGNGTTSADKLCWEQ